MVPLRLAILGTRGVPPQYGGFETFAAELGVRLVARGHEVTVYCREGRESGEGHESGQDSPSPSREDAGEKVAARKRGRMRGPEHWRGIERRVIPHLPGKYFETVSHTLLSAIDAVRRDFDAVLLCNAANAFTLPILRAARIPVAINVDGIERKRKKWNILGRAVYLTGEAFSVSFANAVVADAEVIADYYRSQFGAEAEVIAYGADFPDEPDNDVLQKLGLTPRNYILYVSRFEPENNPLEVVKAYEAIGDAPPLVMVGDGLYAHDLVRELRAHASEKILFPGAIYGAGYRTLQRNALFYVQATEVGGTHPAMIEAMASGGAVLANETPENREVGGDAVGYFRLGSDGTLTASMRQWLAHREPVDAFRERARARAAALYSWDAVTGAYERLLQSLSR